MDWKDLVFHKLEPPHLPDWHPTPRIALFVQILYLFYPISCTHTHQSIQWSWKEYLHGSHDLRGANVKVKRPKGSPATNHGPEGPQTCMYLMTGEGTSTFQRILHLCSFSLSISEIFILEILGRANYWNIIFCSPPLSLSQSVLIVSQTATVL